MTDPLAPIDPELLKKAEFLHSRAMIQLFARGVGFVTNVLCQLDRKWDPAIGTAATDGKSLWISPEFFVGLTDGLRVSVLCHEAWHVAYDHMGRLGDYDMTDWNYSTDYAINQDLKDSGYELGPDWLQDDKWRERTAEEIYKEISSGKSPKPPGFGNGPGQDLHKNPDPNAIKETLSRAATLSKMDGSWGTVPGALQDMIDKMLNPTLPWETLLERYLDQIFQREVSWARRNRMYRDVIMPGWAQQHTEAMNNIVWLFDTSGSVSNSQIQRFLSEVAYVHNTYECERTVINTFDTSVRETFIFEQDEKIEGLTFTGRGGTHLGDAMELAKTQRPRVIVVFSDLECSPYPASQKPDAPVVWLCCDNAQGKAEFGEVIHFDTD